MKRVFLAVTLALIVAVFPNVAEAQVYDQNGNCVGGYPYNHHYYHNYNYAPPLYNGYSSNQMNSYPLNTYPPSYNQFRIVPPTYVSPGAIYIPNPYYAPERGFFGPQYRRLR